MRVCLVYDCLYPFTVGGAERWYRNLGERLAAEGHEVTYLTLRQWDRRQPPEVPGITVVPVGPRLSLYSKGRRKSLPPLAFGIGVLRHLLRHGRRYDVVHTASFPYFSVLAIALARRMHPFQVIVDWHEVWTDSYWREYLGPVGGLVGRLVQRLCVQVGDHAFCFSRLHAARLREYGFGGEIEVLEGEYAGAITQAAAKQAEPIVVFAGRHIPEKRVPLIPSVIAEARRTLPDLRCEVYGDGPDRDELLRRIDAADLRGVVTAPGFVDGDAVESALARALCMLLPSRREGYGLVVVEASSRGTPSVVVRDPDNAATELVDDGTNGYIAESADASALAQAIVRVERAGDELRTSTARWFNRNVGRLSIESSLRRVVLRYQQDAL